jgi:glycosyltransferase involved in cell wall biosynthesis
MPKSNAPLISVVIPTYNRKQSISRALESVYDQSFGEFEVIVVDDCSTDGTPETLRAQNWPRLRIIEHAENKGAAAARNTGFDAAKAPYVALLDSDDEWKPDKLSKQVDVLEERGHPDDVVIFGRALRISDYGRMPNPERGPRPGEPIFDYLINDVGVLYPSSLLLSATLARRVRFDEEMLIYDDPDFGVRLAEATDNFVFLGDILNLYHIHEGEDHVSTSNRYHCVLDWIERQKHSIDPTWRARILHHTVVRSAAEQQDFGSLRRAWQLGYRPPHIRKLDMLRHVARLVCGANGYKTLRSQFRLMFRSEFAT